MAIILIANSMPEIKVRLLRQFQLKKSAFRKLVSQVYTFQKKSLFSVVSNGYKIDNVLETNNLNYITVSFGNTFWYAVISFSYYFVADSNFFGHFFIQVAMKTSFFSRSVS